MSLVARRADLWSLVLDSLTVDPGDLLRAVDAECLKPSLDFRTRLLIRDSLNALSDRGGTRRPLDQLSMPARARAEQVLAEDLGEVRFPSLPRRLVDRTRSDKILSFLAEVGTACRSPCRIDVGGSSALILRELLDRFTEDVDAIDEVPAAIRQSYDLVDRLVARYNLRLTHFQSHYLPAGWERRVQSFGMFGQLSVSLVDPVDIVVGKLFSRREKDLDDVRVLRPLLDWPTVVSRLQSSAGPLRADARSLEAATHNWYVLTGDPLPQPQANAE
jgi:hypothetical protein